MKGKGQKTYSSHNLCVICGCPLDLVGMKPISVFLRLNKEMILLATLH